MWRCVLLGLALFAGCQRPGAPDGPTLPVRPAPRSADISLPPLDAGVTPPEPPVVEEATVDAKALDRDLKKVASDATARGRRVFVYFGATWCGPCRLFKHAFE